jgi:hypothetical protein
MRSERTKKSIYITLFNDEISTYQTIIKLPPFLPIIDFYQLGNFSNM